MLVVLAAVTGGMPPMAQAAREAPFRQVKPVSIEPQPTVEFRGASFFIGQSVQSGVSLFRVDGAGKASVIGSLCARTRSDCRTRDHGLVLAGDRLVIHSQRDGGRLWTSDGDDNPTRMYSAQIRRYGMPVMVEPVAGRIAILMTRGLNKTHLAVADPAGAEWTPIAKGASTIIGSTGGGAVFYTDRQPGALDGFYRWRPGEQPVLLSRANSISDTNLLQSFVAVGEDAYFLGYDEAHGEEPWFGSGTDNSARLIADLTPGAASTLINWSSEHDGAWLAGTTAGTFVGQQGTLEQARLPGTPVGRFGTRTLLVAPATATSLWSWRLWTTSEPALEAREIAVPVSNGRFNISGVAAAADGVFVITSDENWTTGGAPIDSFWKVTESGVGATPFFTQPRLYCHKGGCEAAFRLLGTNGSRLLFTLGNDVWISDGTPAGTRRITQPGEFARIRPTVGLNVSVATSKTAAAVTASGVVGASDAPASIDVCRGRVRAIVKRRGSVLAVAHGRLQRLGGVCRYELELKVNRRVLRGTPHAVVRVETSGAGRVAGSTSEAQGIEP